MGMITLLRHGQTDFNATGLLQGHIDNSLNRTGFAQAEKAAEAIGEVDRIISSPLKRAIQTADAFNKEIEISTHGLSLTMENGMENQSLLYQKKSGRNGKTTLTSNPPKANH